MSELDKTITRIQSKYMEQYDAYIERQKRKRKRLIRRLVLFAIIAMLSISSMAIYHMKQRSLHAEKVEQYSQLENELATLKEQEKDYNEEIELLNDDEYVLEIARTNYFFSKEGELIFKITDQDPSY